MVKNYKNVFFASFTTRLLRYVLRTVLVSVQNAPGILVYYSGKLLAAIEILPACICDITEFIQQ